MAVQSCSTPSPNEEGISEEEENDAEEEEEEEKVPLFNPIQPRLTLPQC